MVEHKVGELVLMALTSFSKPVYFLGIIKKIDDGIKVGTKDYCVDWLDGVEKWYTSEGIEEMKSDLWTYYEAQNR